MNDPEQDETIDLRIAEVVAEWMETAEAERPSASDFVDQYPELAPGLAECLSGLERIEQGKAMLSGGSSDGSDLGDDEVEFPAIPDYEVLGELGRGGMGVVYEAKQVSLDRFVALKVLPFGAVDGSAVKRFLREAETVASLTHPGIVPVYAVGVHGGLNWYAMQRIDGCPLSQWFAVSTFASRADAIAEVVRVGIEAAEALEYAHQNGVIHRDVKPGNLLVDRSGKVWLTDFGLARRDVDVTATATGAMMGTPRYMSAEQISGHDAAIDARTDIYSLGATLYEMATGRPPFTSESPLTLLTQIQRDEPARPRQIDPTISRSLELVILKCLDKEPQRRYESAANLANDLKAIRDDKPISARGLPASVRASRFLKRHKRQINSIATTAMATIATLVAVVLLWQQSVESQFGSVRINTPAGLYVTNIWPRASSQFEDRQDDLLSQSQGNAGRLYVVKEPIESTLATSPMQRPVKLPAGEYDVRLEGDGNLSQTVSLSVKPEELSELQYVDRREPPPQVDILGKLAVSVSGDRLAVLGKESFDVFEPDADQGESRPRFTVPIAELDAELAEAALAARPADASDQGDPPLTFAFDSQQTFQGDFYVSHSGFARIERICEKPIDLNGDDESDYLVTAARHAAIAAIASDGTVLWKRHLPMSFEIKEARSRWPKNGMVNEAIVGIMPVDDLNDDGTGDLVINAALFDPSGFSRPHVFTLSGRDGTVVAVAPLPTINMRKVTHWPWSGLLRHRRDFNSEHRMQRPINAHHFSLLSMRSPANIIHNDSWGGNSANSALYVLPRLLLDKHNGANLAVTAIDQTVHFVSLSGDTEMRGSIALQQPICRGPIRVRLSDGKLGVAVLTGIPSSGFTKCFLQLCVKGEATARWTVPQEVGADDLVAEAADSSFPLALDLDGDGIDEILTTTNPDVPFGWPSLNCFDATSGKLKWTTAGVAGISPIVDRALPVRDIDSDGVIDLAVVGLSQRQTTNELPDADGLRLVIDFLSGASGERLGFRDERVATEVKGMQVVEIDFVELVGHELVCSIVYGAPEELQLSSVTINIDLTQLSQAQVARGLTVLGPVNLRSGTAAKGRWHRRRSGPYANDADTAVWIERPLKRTTYPGANVLAAWVSADKQPRVLLNDKNGGARCVDPIRESTLWQAEQAYFNWSSVFAVPAAGGGVDLLMQKYVGNHMAIELYDAETGRFKFQLQSPDLGSLRYVVTDDQDPERYAYALAPPNGGMNQGYLLIKIDRVEQRLVWSLPCYESQNATKSWLHPAKLFQLDLNGDGVNDLVTGNGDGTRLIVQAIDGLGGKTIWELPLKVDVKQWPWNVPWPMMATVASGEQNFLLVIDAVDGDERAFDLKSIRLSDGRVLDSLRDKAMSPLKSDAQSGALAIETIAPKQRDGLVGLRISVPPSGKKGDHNEKARWRVLHVAGDSGAITTVDDFAATQETITADIDGDAVLDRIDFRRNTSTSIHRGETNELIGKFQPPEGFSIREIQQVAGESYAMGAAEGNEHQWLELPSGRVALRFGEGLQSLTYNQTKFPRLLEHDGGVLLVGSTPEAVVCAEVHLAAAVSETIQASALPIAMISPDADSRYMKEVKAVGLYDRKSFADVVRLAVLATGAILLPLVYVIRLIRRRQWSLQSLLMAPAIVLLSLVAWRALTSGNASGMTVDFITGVMSALSIWAIVFLVRNQQWKTLALGVGVSVITATLLMFGAQALIGLQVSGVNGYWTLSGWLAAVSAAAAQIVMPLAAGVAFARTKSKHSAHLR